MPGPAARVDKETVGFTLKRMGMAMGIMDASIRSLVGDAYHEAAEESLARGLSLLTAHKEAVVAAAMLLSAMTGLEDDNARTMVVSMNLRPVTGT